MVALKEALQKKLTAKELFLLRASFDIVGNIALLEIPDELKKKEKNIAEAVLQQNAGVKTVLKKQGKHGGKYRLQKMRWLAGEKTKETIHKESGVRIKLDVEKAYFSPRLATERMRIAKLVKDRESVLVMFSGVAPYPLILAKYSPAKKIVAIEKNPVAHKYAVENSVLNKISSEKMVLVKGDVQKKVPLLKQKFDRIIMPLPKTSVQFLPLAFKVLKKKGIIHLYHFVEEHQVNSAKEEILAVCKKENKQCHVLQIVKAGQYAPHKYRLCFDVEIE